jgi:hypothetical protein
MMCCIVFRRFTVYKPARSERRRDECGDEEGESTDDEVQESIETIMLLQC